MLSFLGRVLVLIVCMLDLKRTTVGAACPADVSASVALPSAGSSVLVKLARKGDTCSSGRSLILQVHKELSDYVASIHLGEDKI